MKKKIFGAEIWKGYCPNRIVRGGLYCNTRFVLQPRWLESGWFKEALYCNMGSGLLGNCIAIQLLYCNTTIVLQAGSWAEYIAIGRICIARFEGYCRMGKEVSR